MTDDRVSLSRRSLLRGGVTAGLAVGIARALHNTTLGYGQFGWGENLRSQDLGELVDAALPLPRLAYLTVGGTDLRITRRDVRYRNGEDWRPASSDAAPRIARELARDIEALVSGRYTCRFRPYESFIEAIDSGRTRPTTVSVLRGRRESADRSVVASFAGSDPADPHALLDGLATGFRTHAHYDYPRYLAGSLEDNVLFGGVDLRGPFEPEESFDVLLKADRSVGLFCTELTRLSIAALHAAPVDEQAPPLFGFYVRNSRHKHAYTGIGTAIRTEADTLELILTFVDYTPILQLSDARLDGLLGRELNAYDDRHRATTFLW